MDCVPLYNIESQDGEFQYTLDLNLLTVFYSELYNGEVVGVSFEINNYGFYLGLGSWTLNVRGENKEYKETDEPFVREIWYSIQRLTDHRSITTVDIENKGRIYYLK